MILDLTGKRLRAWLDGAPAANQPEWSTSWADINDLAPTFIPGNETGVLNGVTPVEIIEPPAGAEQRQAKYISIFNTDTAQVKVWIDQFDGSSTPLFYATLEANERLVWEDDVGWQIFNAAGLPSPGIVSPLTTKGDIWGYDALDNRVPVGSDGQILVADSTQGLGVLWTSSIPPLAWAVKTLTVLDTPYAILDTDQILLADAVGGAITATLPAAVGYTGRQFRIKKLDASVNAVILAGNGGELVDGAVNVQLTLQHETVTVVCDGTEWWIV